jgi:pyruvate dehydrogenase E2 component (dihydrolipoamide acetyltransferase)
MPASGRASSAPGGAVDIGARLGLYTLREGSGTPLVLLHGFGADHGIWRGFAGRLATPAPVLGIDLPGHGAAHGHPARSVPEMVDALARELTDAGLSRVHLCGHSLGGALAAELAGGGLLDVRSLTLLAPAGLTPAIDGAFIDALCRCTREDSLRPWLRQLVHDPASLPDALVRALVAARQDAATTRAHRALADAVFPEGTQAVDIRLALARMGGPLKVIVGAADRIIPPSGTRGLPARAGVHTLPAVGHLPHLEDPETVASLLDEALRSAP